MPAACCPVVVVVFWLLLLNVVRVVCLAVSSPICQSTLKCATGGYEIVASTATGAAIVSGGGFSVYAARPSYQTTVRTALVVLRVV